ncbi:helix-turn-helix transcriptional regulator [Coxiella burnetii]|uniref:Bacterial regulatory protein, luxR family n=3 Tax=Coxiella burnetii TaxID=777 RepID=Q83AS5_COXBU|nr:LuxR C-terminal-related transcriptional regulator [Coxiella burnetii]NP_820784.1 LuxR family transcriptional regulator [Coxiella burnetii RSA 493]AAO91298.1 bacterial regulatory protein, luxR family [Coxiella burnetii RSA 493]ABS76938.1 bacterial regulatory protein, luxR family [Coxiella burnetii Dugway 5J108-111]ABX77825.1 transcriptional regulator, LuxR family [Coxiella burnetii RSA 331]AML48302.1 helix-turn-helix transcriptional regulator [Coxiella burnetii]AML54315.1 helix-turn-helix t
MSDTNFQIWIKGLLASEDKKTKIPPKSPQKRFLDRHYVGEPYPKVYFTNREFTIATYLLKGYRYKQIAEVLNLSSRSVEFYIQNMREKFYCRNKRALIGVLKNIDILSHHPRDKSGDDGPKIEEKRK